MAKNELIEAIAEAAYEPEEDRSQELKHKYKALGLDGPDTVWSTCWMVLEDEEEPTVAKLAIIGIIDNLMELNEAALAQYLVVKGHLQFFHKTAKKLNETFDFDRLPEGFPPTAEAEEVTAFITAVCEFLDKYGRCFEASSSPLKEYAKIRKDVSGQRGFPSPDRYQYVNPNFSAPPPSSAKSSGSGKKSKSESKAHHTSSAPSPAAPQGGGLSEEYLESLVFAAHEARGRYGDGDRRTAQAYAAAEAELQRWQDAVFAAAEEEDFEAMERYQAADDLYREMLNSSDYTPPADQPKSKKKKKHRGHGHEEDSSLGGAPDPWGMDPSAYGFGEDPSAYGFGEQDWPQDSGFPGQGEGWSGAEERPRKTREELESEVQSLQVQLQKAQEAYYRDGPGARLQLAHSKISELESIQLLVVDAKSSLEHLTDVNENLERELQTCRSQLREARNAALEAEDKLLENEQLLTQQRQKLFAQNYNAVQLEDEVKKCEEVHGDLHDQLQAKKDQHRTHELELRRAQLAHHKASTRNPFATSPQDSSKTPLQQLAQEEIRKNRPPSTSTLNHVVLRRTSAEVWAATPHAAAEEIPVVMRHPPGSSEWLQQATASFCNLLVRRKGCIYQDDKVGIEMSISYVPQGSTRPVISFEMAVANLGGQPIHDINMVAQKVKSSANFELRLQLCAGQDRGNVLWPKKVLRYWGELEALDAFDEWPNICFSYLLGDNLSCKALLRLPIAITRLLSPARVSKEKFVELWNATERAHHEVAFVCYVKEELLSFGSASPWMKYLQFGGSLHCILGLDENPGSVVLAALWVEHQNGKPVEVVILVRAELGNPGSPGGRLGFPGVSDHAGKSGTPASLALRQQCRVAVRSTEHHVNKALAKVILEILARPQM